MQVDVILEEATSAAFSFSVPGARPDGKWRRRNDNSNGIGNGRSRSGSVRVARSVRPSVGRPRAGFFKMSADVRAGDE